MNNDAIEKKRARFRQVMKSSGLNVSQWAELAGKPESTLRTFLKSDSSRDMMSVNVEAFARAANVSAAYLMGIDDANTDTVNDNSGFAEDPPALFQYGNIATATQAAILAFKMCHDEKMAEKIGQEAAQRLSKTNEHLTEHLIRHLLSQKGIDHEKVTDDNHHPIAS